MTCKQAEEKIQVEMVPTHVQLKRDFAPPKGGERPAALTPQRDLAGWRRTKLRLAAGRLLVALGRVRVLFLCAKHLFATARRAPPGCRCAFQVSAGGYSWSPSIMKRASPTGTPEAPCFI